MPERHLLLRASAAGQRHLRHVQFRHLSRRLLLQRHLPARQHDCIVRNRRCGLRRLRTGSDVRQWCLHLQRDELSRRLLQQRHLRSGREPEQHHLRLPRRRLRLLRSRFRVH